MSVNFKDINTYHVMLGVVIGAGGVLAGMQLLALHRRRKILLEKKRQKSIRSSRIVDLQQQTQQLPALFHSPEPPDIRPAPTNADPLGMDALLNSISEHSSGNNSSNRTRRDHQQQHAFNNKKNDKNDDVQTLLSLLYKIGEAQMRRENTLHRGISCNICCSNPLNGVRFKCLNCVDYDVCSQCEPSCDHDITHVFVKITIPIPPLANPRTTLLPVFYPGKKMAAMTLRWEEAVRMRSKTHFDPTRIEVLHEQYRSLCTHKNGITRDTFLLCLGPLSSKKNLVVDQLFRFYDNDGDGYINFNDFIHGMSVLSKGTKTERIKYIFKGYDLDNDGFISKDDLQQMLKAYHQLSMELVRDVVRSCEEEMMANYDEVGNRPISAVFNAPIPESVNIHHQNTSPQSSKQSLNSHKNKNNAATKNTSSSSTMDGISTSNSSLSDGSVVISNVFQRQSSLNAISRKNTNYERFSAVEAMTQDAIVELVDQIMLNADLDKDGRLSESEFYQYAVIDTSLLCWFEAIDTVF